MLSYYSQRSDVAARALQGPPQQILHPHLVQEACLGLMLESRAPNEVFGQGQDPIAERGRARDMVTTARNIVRGSTRSTRKRKRSIVLPMMMSGGVS